MTTKVPEKSSEQPNQASLDSDRESDNSDVQATRALIQKLSPVKPKPAGTKVREIFILGILIIYDACCNEKVTSK